MKRVWAALSSLPPPLAPRMFAEGTPPLGLLALIRPGLTPGRRLHLLGQLLRAAGDKRPLAADRDPHALQRIKQDAPPGEPGPGAYVCVVSRMGIVVWMASPYC